MHYGRFYPGKLFKDDIKSVSELYSLGRMVKSGRENLLVDFNHPLATKDIILTVQIEAIRPTAKKHPKLPTDIITLLGNGGPGMQDRLNECETDFWSEQPFARLDESDDAVFFAEPSLSPFWDSVALTEVSKLYDQLIPDNAVILDLMAGVHSPLQECAINPRQIICAGLNRIELDNNPVCTERHVLNVNRIKALPFKTAKFDAVLIHAAIEYVTQPATLLKQINRVLKPGGRIIISFTNRYVEEKAIQIWKTIHPFERIGLILAELRKNGHFGSFQALSRHGLPGSGNNLIAGEVADSDPVFLISADKINK